MEVGYGQQLGFAVGQPLPRCRALTFGAVAVTAANGKCPLAALWAKSVMGSWGPLGVHFTVVSANTPHHYEAPFSKAISLSGGRKTPRRSCGGTMASIASSFSVGSPRV